MKQILIILFALLSAFDLNGDPCDIPVNDQIFSSMPFLDFVELMEKTHNIRFFLKPDWVDSIAVSNSKKTTTLQQILDENLSGTKLSYYLYNCNKIILTKDYTFLEDIPASLFDQTHILSAANEINPIEGSFIKQEYRSNYQHNNNIVNIGDPSDNFKGKSAVITGHIRDVASNEPVIGAVVYIDNHGSVAVTNKYGFYSISTAVGKHDLHIESFGKKEKTINVTVYSDGTLNETLEDKAVSLDEIYVYANKEHNVKDIQIGVERLNARSIKEIPSSVGEADILKMVLLFPGVQTVGEGASGFNVRGGSTDQNLILIDNAPVYNSSHLFGFFSAINAEMVQDFELYKSGYPAYYGGRLSSIFDVKLKKGNPRKFSLTGGISPITGKLLLEGPIIKNKITFLVSGRSTYSDWLLKRINSPILENSSASFYDINAKVNFVINERNMLQLSGYKSHDFFKLNSDTSYTYHNLNGSLSWKHSFNDRFSFTTVGVFSEYRYNVGSTSDSLNAFDLTYGIRHFEGKIDFHYLPGDNHKIRFGANFIKYSLNPGAIEPKYEESILAVRLNSEQGIESALFVNDEINISHWFMLNLGFRYSLFHSLGPATVYKYADNSPRNIESRMDSVFYKRNAVTGHYGYPEWRVSARFQLSPFNSIKASYTTMSQYIHMLTNTMAVSPTDTWTLSNPNRKPQKSRQWTLGYYHNFFKDRLEASVETYYKVSENIPEYKPGARLLVNPDLELDLLSGKGRAYGVEFMLKKQSGKINGWLSYTYSRSLLKMDSKFREERINGGRYYPANYDKPHDLTLVANYRFSRRVSFSSTLTYNTGHPITYPVAWYTFRDRELLHYSDRNEYRIPDYFRIDFSMNFEGNLKTKKLAHSSWSFSVYNLTGRDNVYSVYFVSDPYKSVKGYKLSVFTQPIPSITYNFKF